MSNDYLLSKAIEKVAEALERDLKTDRNLVIEENAIILARKVCLNLGIFSKVGSTRTESGYRSPGTKTIWFVDRVQKEMFLEAYSLAEEDPKPLVEENVFRTRETFTVVEPDGS